MEERMGWEQFGHDVAAIAKRCDGGTISAPYAFVERKTESDASRLARSLVDKGYKRTRFPMSDESSSFGGYIACEKQGAQIRVYWLRDAS